MRLCAKAFPVTAAADLLVQLTGGVAAIHGLGLPGEKGKPALLTRPLPFPEQIDAINLRLRVAAEVTGIVRPERRRRAQQQGLGPGQTKRKRVSRGQQ